MIPFMECTVPHDGLFSHHVSNASFVLVSLAARMNGSKRHCVWWNKFKSFKMFGKGTFCVCSLVLDTF